MSAHTPSPAAAETRALLHLAVPIMVAQLAHTATGFVDTVMAGRLGGAGIMVTLHVLGSLFMTLLGIWSAGFMRTVAL